MVFAVVLVVAVAVAVAVVAAAVAEAVWWSRHCTLVALFFGQRGAARTHGATVHAD